MCLFCQFFFLNISWFFVDIFPSEKKKLMLCACFVHFLMDLVSMDPRLMDLVE